MTTNGIADILVKLSDEDETKRLEIFKTILEFLLRNSDDKGREQIRIEFNRLSKEIFDENDTKRK